MHQKRQTLSYVKSSSFQILFIVFNYKMATKQLNIKSRPYYFYNDLINVLNFETSNLKIDKKTWKNIDIYFIGYVDKKSDWNVNSVNLLYLITDRVYGYVSEKNGVRFLKIDKGDSLLKKYDQVLLVLNIILKKLIILMSIIIVNMKKLNF